MQLKVLGIYKEVQYDLKRQIQHQSYTENDISEGVGARGNVLMIWERLFLPPQRQEINFSLL